MRRFRNLFVYRLLPKIRKSLALESIVMAGLILAALQGALFPAAQEVFITLVSETAGEICLCDVTVDGANIPLHRMVVVDNSGWLYRGEYDNFVIWPKEDGVDNRLTMRFFAEEIHVGFPYTPYAGSVTITSSTGDEETLNLRCPERERGADIQYADIFFDCRRVYTPLERCVYNGGFLLILSVFILTVFQAVRLLWRKSTIHSDTERLPAPAATTQKRCLREHSSMILYLVTLFAAILFAILYYQSITPFNYQEDEALLQESLTDGSLRENKDIYQLDTNIYDVYISVFPTADENGEILNFSAFDLHTEGDHSYNPVLNCNIQILPEGQVPKASLNQKNATIRVRGNSTRGAPYKSYKVRLNPSTEDFFGQRVLNLNKDTQDVSKVATKLSTDLLAGMDNVVSYRTYFMRLWIRDASLPPKYQWFEYQGMYIELEQPNKTYLRARGLDEEGSLYKARAFTFHPNDAIRDVDDPLYSQEAFEQVLGIREGGSSHKKLIEMLDAVNDDSRDFREIFTKYFNEDNYLTWLAFNLLMGNEDIGSQNYLLFNPEKSSTWYFIHWDFDGSLRFGNYESESPISLRGIQRLFGSSLHRRYFQEIPGSIEKLDAKMRELLDTSVTRERVAALLDAYKPVLEKTLTVSPDLRTHHPLEERFSYLDNLYDGILHNYDVVNISSQYPFPGFVAIPIRNPDGSIQFAWEPFRSFTALPVSYRLRIYSDYNMQNLVYEASGLQETEFLLEDGLPNGTYYLRVSGTDAGGREQISLEQVVYREDGAFHHKDGLLEFTME